MVWTKKVGTVFQDQQHVGATMDRKASGECHANGKRADRSCSDRDLILKASVFLRFLIVLYFISSPWTLEIPMVT
jgi:hypothetical protein